MDYFTLSQRDPRWARKTLGFTRTTIGQYGCTLVALTCLLNRLLDMRATPDMVNEKLKEVKAFSDGKTIGKGNLLVWARVPLAFPQLSHPKSGGRVRSYNNLVVSTYVYLKRTPVMVEVNADSIGAPRHWVLYIGGRECVDPWVGKVVKTNKYPAVGYALFNRA